MKLPLLSKLSALVALTTVLASGTSRAQDTIYGIGGSGANPTSLSLFSFSSSNPGAISALTPITGITAGFTLEGIDFRPATGQLYGLAYNGTNTAQLYVLNTVSGVASSVGAQFAIGSAQGGFGLSIGIGFNPSVDLLRVVTGTNGNFRVNPTTGVISTPADGGLAYAPGDVNFNSSYQVAEADYLGGNLYDIDYINNVLAQQNPPNNGTLNTIGPLGITLTSGTRSTGFDIGPTGIAYLSGKIAGDTGNRQRLFTVNLANGNATSVGLIGTDSNFNIVDLAVAVPEPSTWAMLAIGLALLGVMASRSRLSA